MTPTDSVEGVLPVDKPAGPTSHDMVARARRALGTRRIGHTGTLDPFASGLMLLCVGRATRIAEYLSGMDKRYTAVVRLGVSTDTCDATGSITAERDAAGVSRADIETALRSQRGAILQTPPAYSAKKVGGERSYALAREGRAVELEPVPVIVHEITLTRFETPHLHLDVRCSSGTYIRAIARDLGAALGVGAHLTALRRTAVGSHSIEHSVSADDLALMADARRRIGSAAGDDAAPGGAATAGAATPAVADNADKAVADNADKAVADNADKADSADSADPFDVLRSRLIPTLEALGAMPRVDVTADEITSIGQGRAIARDGGVEGVVALAAGGDLIAIAHAEAGRIRPRKVFL